MAARGFEAALETIQLGLAFIPARAIYAAAKLGIADHIESTPQNATALSEKLDVNAAALTRILRVLVSLDLFEQDGEGRYSLSELGQTLCSDAPDSVRDFIILNHELPYRAFDNIMHSLRTGRPADVETFGAPLFQFLKDDPGAAAVFHAGLRSRGRLEIPSILDAYDFSMAAKIVDVGGGTGALLAAILSRYGNVEGVLFDAGPVIDAARSGPLAAVPNCELVDGDFFQAVPRGGDVYILKFVLHDWLDEDAIRILNRCRDAMGENSRLLVIEGLTKETGGLTMTDVMDLTMLVQLGGMERSEQDYARLFQQAGLKPDRIVATSSALSILEATKA